MPTPLPASVKATAQPFFNPHSPAVPMAPYTPREPDEAPSTTQGLAGLKLSGTCTATTVRLRPENRGTPQDPRVDFVVTMTALWNHERFGDWQGARDELAMRLRRHGAQFSAAARRMLEFRLALLEERLGGGDPLPRFMEDADEAVRAAAALIQRQQRDGGDDTERRRQRQLRRIGPGLGKVVVGLGQRHPGQGRGIVLCVLRLGRVVF